jgi:hypothetical protein
LLVQPTVPLVNRSVGKRTRTGAGKIQQGAIQLNFFAVPISAPYAGANPTIASYNAGVVTQSRSRIGSKFSSF